MLPWLIIAGETKAEQTVAAVVINNAEKSSQLDMNGMKHAALKIRSMGIDDKGLFLILYLILLMDRL